MARSFTDMKKQIEALSAALKAAQQKALGIIEAKMQDVGLTIDDLVAHFGGAQKSEPAAPRRGRIPKSASVAPKVKIVKGVFYRHPSGATWAGHGKRPGWIKEADAKGGREQYEVKAGDSAASDVPVVAASVPAAPAKKTRAKKAVSAKKVAAKPAAPAKKAQAVKAAPSKKAAPAKKPAASNQASPVKAVAPKKAVAAKSAAPAKKVVPAKKAAPAKTAAPAKKPVAVKATPAKQAPAPAAAPAAPATEAGQGASTEA